MPKSEFLRSALHAEYFVPQGFHSVMAAPVLANGSHCGVVVAFGSRRRGDFDEPYLAELAGLAGHLSRAIGLRLDCARLTEDLHARNHVLDDAPDGILLLDKHIKTSPGPPQIRRSGRRCCSCADCWCLAPAKR